MIHHFFRTSVGYFLLPLFIVIITFLMLNFGNSDHDHDHGYSQTAIQSKNAVINAVVGDQSYVDRYGLLPESEVPDSVRIRVHLSYVEELLRQRPTHHLTAKQRRNRSRYLDLLREYRKAGNFPHNDGHSDNRRPTFIDKNGNICAVGYLVAQTLGRDVATKINQDYKYAFIQQIDHPVFKNWVESSGFTLKELAMIQPMYGGEPGETITRKSGNNNKIGALYGTASLLTNAANGLYWSNSAKNPWLFNSEQNFHWYGLAAGTGSILLGSLNLDNRRVVDKTIIICGFVPSPCNNVVLTQSNHARTAVSAFNIAAGAATTLRAVYHLLTNTGKKKNLPASSSALQLGQIQTVSNGGAVQPLPVLRFRISL